MCCVCVFGWWGDVGVYAAEGETNHCDKLRSKLDEREESVSGQLVSEQYQRTLLLRCIRRKVHRKSAAWHL